MKSSRDYVLGYYRSLESKLGYKYITGETKHFGYYPDACDTISEHQAQQLMSDKVAENLKLRKNQSILDAGCGYGVTACYLARKYSVRVTGIDINEYEIERAAKRARELMCDDKVKFTVMDYSHTKFPKNTFDAIFTLETLSHAPNLTQTLKEFLTLLRPKGKIALFEYTLASPRAFSPWELKMLEVGIKGTAALGLREFRHDQFPKYLRSIGFKNVKEQDITKNMLPSLKRLKNIAQIPYFFIKCFGSQSYFVNTTVAVEWYELIKKGLIRYCIFTGEK